MIRRPTPGIGAHPGPAIVVFPDPAAILIRRPIGPDIGGLPHRTIIRIVHPLAVLIQILGAADVGADVPVALRTLNIAVALVIPAIEIVVRSGLHDLELRIRSLAARIHGLARFQVFPAPLAIDFSFAQAHRDLGCSVFMHRHSIGARPQRTNGHAGRIHFYLRLAGAQRAERHRAGRDLNLETAACPKP